jgi:hypothetical protein
MRSGRNPLKYKEIAKPPKVVAAAIVHLPNQDGYHSERFEIVKLSLLSMREYGNVPVLVWDNGSCEALRDWLVNEYKPDYLILSPNVGKTSAMAGIFRMFPPETIISCADDDMLYSAGWLTAELEVLDRFPPAVVSASPNRFAFEQGHNEYTLNFARSGDWLKVGKFIPDDWELDFAHSLGVIKPLAPNQLDYRINYNGMLVYASAQHCQFLTSVKDFAPLTQFDNYGSADENKLDERIDAAGILRLTTNYRYVQHMGNVLDADLRKSIPIFAPPRWKTAPYEIQTLGAEVI